MEEAGENDAIHEAAQGYTYVSGLDEGNTDNTGIGLLETLWKLVEAIFDSRLKECITLHGVLHVFCVGR